MRVIRFRPTSRVSRLSLWLAGAFLLATGCTSSLVNYEAQTHVVQPGETLLTIAWRYRRDYRQLARINGLDDPDLIFVGQRLQLHGTPAATSASAPASTARSQSLPPPAILPPPTWRWPANGEVVSRFGADSGLGNGIGIAGSLGAPVHAAAPGRVVYAGSGLIGYGQLLIIKHNDTYLSAYGHNSRLVVQQGDNVSSGQMIAEMGNGPAQRPQLHFEIRRNGVPEDPLRHLPR